MGQTRLISTLLLLTSVCSVRADLLGDPPMVSAASWLVGTPEGQVIASHRAGKQVQIASLTKIMTAMLVLEQIGEDTFSPASTTAISKQADDTLGTSALLGTGEVYSIDQLLHGLLLPSGNDAAMALAEYTGRRAKKGSGDSVTRFVSMMQHRAAGLGLTSTIFLDPHGMGENLSTAEDVFHLTIEAMKSPTFRLLVSHSDYEISLRTPKGEPRQVHWRNTNQLLGVEGITGIKTGHSNHAEGCLVIAGSWSDRTLYVVVLGSDNEKSRFIDAYNLYRWGVRSLSQP